MHTEAYSLLFEVSIEIMHNLHILLFIITQAYFHCETPATQQYFVLGVVLCFFSCGDSCLLNNSDTFFHSLFVTFQSKYKHWLQSAVHHCLCYIRSSNLTMSLGAFFLFTMTKVFHKWLEISKKEPCASILW